MVNADRFQPLGCRTTQGRLPWALAAVAALVVGCQAGPPAPELDSSPTLATPAPAPTPASPEDAWPPPAAVRLPAAIVTDTSEGRVYGLAIDPSTGQIQRGDTLAFHVSGWGVVVTPTGTTAYVSSTGCTQALRVDGLGHVAAVAGACSQTGGDSPISLVVHPTRRLLYSLETRTFPLPTLVRGFHAATDGTLSAVSAAPLALSGDSLLIHPGGVFAYDAGNEYRIGASGAFERVAALSPALPWLAFALIEPTGRYLVVPDGGKIVTYRIDSQTGAPAFAAETPLPDLSPYDGVRIAAHPTRNLIFVYRTSGLLETYQLDDESGRLTQLAARESESPAAHESSLHVEPGGRFVFLRRTVSLWEDLNIRGFRVEADGSLSPIDGSFSAPDAFSTAFFLGPRS